METKPETWTIKEIIDEFDAGQLAPNTEYQRGVVWQKRQQQMLIDSLLRGYHLPVFYFHVIRVSGKHGTNTRFEIIDGQQRVSSIMGFVKGEFVLLDPAAASSRFARHLRDEPCEWSNLAFDQLSPELREIFMSSEVTVAEIVDATINEARDLFVRLQQGSDLTAQERRDALPGEFGGVVERIAGRRGRSHGHAFFREVMRMKPHTDRGRTRQFVAQLLAAFFEFNASRHFIDLNKASIDQHYYDYMELGSQTEVVESFETVLNDIYESLQGWQGRGLPNHLVLHLFVMWQQLEGHYTKSWKSDSPRCIEDFMLELNEANSLFKSGLTSDFYNEYAVRTKAANDQRDTIRRRHQFFMERMHSQLNLVPLDRRRSFDAYQRDYVYLKSRGVCAYADHEICGDRRVMAFEDGEVHHVLPRSKGGATDLDNAVWTHRECNRKIGNVFISPPSNTEMVAEIAINDSVGDRLCRRCQQTKPLTEEHWHKNVILRGNGDCKPCTNNRVNEWRRKKALQQ